MNRSWTIFGAGDFFIAEIVDAILAREETIEYFVFNNPPSERTLRSFPKGTRTVPVEEFEAKTAKYFFGFLSPAKEAFLATLEPFRIEFANLAHPCSYVSELARTGEGNYFGPGSVIGPEVRLGRFNYINRTASVGHHTVLGDFNHVGPGATIAGRCEIGDANFFGAGSTVIDQIKVADRVILGAGAVATRSLEGSRTYVGVPARPLP